MSPTAETILDELDADQLERRLCELEAERRAVLILLRAARARRRGKAKDGTAPLPTGGGHAA